MTDERFFILLFGTIVIYAILVRFSDWLNED
jgi:hypothetical protein